MAQIVQQFNTTSTWVCPAGVTAVQVEVWGGGGNGSTRTTNGAGGGGGGGAYAKLNTLSVTPGNSYTVTVGTAGNSSWFSTIATVFAPGGTSVANNTSTGGAGGNVLLAIGDVVHGGGNGGNGSGSNGGGGGGSGGNSTDGGNGGAPTGGTAGTGTPSGAAGGDGGVSNNDGSAGSLPGAGGGGAHRSSGTRNGGAGGRGRVTLTWDYPGDFYVASYTVAQSNSGTGVTTLAKPDGTAENDLLIAHIGADNNSSITPPSGWASIRRTVNGGGTSEVESFFKVATNSEPSTYDFTNATSATFAGSSMECIKGASVSSPIATDAGNDGGTGPTITNGGITPTTSGSMIVFAVMTANSSTPGSSVSGYAVATDNPVFIMAYDDIAGSGVNRQHMAWAIRSQTSATGNATATVSITGFSNFIQLFAINPASSGPAGVKTANGVAAASIKTLDGVTYANVKSVNAVT